MKLSQVMPLPGPSSVRYVALDGLRGWAALGVVCWHLFVEVFPYGARSKSFLLLFTPINGLVAVYLFFIISGFSLSISFVRRQDMVGLARLAAGRYPRLALPILAICIFLYLSVVTGITPSANSQPAPLTGFPAVTPTLDYLFRFSLFDVFFRYSSSQSLIAPLWTIPIEILGSTIVLGLLALVGRWRKRIWIYIAVAAILISLNSIYILFVSGLIFAEISERWVPRSYWEGRAGHSADIRVIGADAHAK